jgi:hypothetical protein
MRFACRNLTQRIDWRAASQRTQVVACPSKRLHGSAVGKLAWLVMTGNGKTASLHASQKEELI